MKKIFCFKPVGIFLSIENLDYINKITKKTGITYSHVCKTINIFEKEKLIETKIWGRQRVINLTDKGIKIKKLLGVFEDE